MLEVIISYADGSGVETMSILTYLRGEKYWQFLTTEGATVSIPDHSIKKIEVHPMTGNVSDGESN
tara:strand:+ start:262 stop:456 length:195 start_codon:yes stop_codon:yes gene_type:complete